MTGSTKWKKRPTSTGERSNRHFSFHHFTLPFFLKRVEWIVDYRHTIYPYFRNVCKRKSILIRIRVCSFKGLYMLFPSTIQCSALVILRSAIELSLEMLSCGMPHCLTAAMTCLFHAQQSEISRPYFFCSQKYPNPMAKKR